MTLLELAERIASRPRWRASPRATACLGLSALIACVGCMDQADHARQFDSVAFGNAIVVAGDPARLRAWSDPETGCIYLRADRGMSIRYRRDGTPNCPDAGPALPRGAPQ